jgi:hypothetical protein
MLKKFVQLGPASEDPEADPLGYVEGLNDARTKLADFFSIPLNEQLRFRVRGERNNGG